MVDYDIISGTEAAYEWCSDNTLSKEKKEPEMHNPDQFWAKVNNIQKKMQELIVNFEELKTMKSDVVRTNKDSDQ